MSALAATLLIVAGVSPPAIEQAGAPLPPALATNAEQAADDPAAAVSVQQLPATPRKVRQPAPPPLRSTTDPTRAELARATATILERGQGADPELIAREVGPDTLIRLVTGAGDPGAKPRLPAPVPAPAPTPPRP